MRLVLYKQRNVYRLWHVQLCAMQHPEACIHTNPFDLFSKGLSRPFLCSGFVNQFIINVDPRSVNQLYTPRGYARSS